MKPAVEMKNIEKSFGANKVLNGVDFTLMPGSIHALLGENGTGKTTLMNILGNIIPKDNGLVEVYGQTYEGIEIKEHVAFIHQELSLVNDLTIYENVFLGREIKKGPFLDKKAMIQEAQNYINLLQVDLKPKQMVSSLNPALKQITEILRAVMQNAKVIIMDEPTSSLTDVEIDHVFNVIRNLKAQGVSIVFISHKLNEVMEICDAYTVMRDGHVVATGFIGEGINEYQLSSYMVGKDLSTELVYQARPLGDVILELKDLTREREYSQVTMNLRAGEILGVTGLLGDGRSEVFASVVGANYPYKGSIYINGQELNIRNTTIAMKHNISYVPKNRKENGIIADLNIKENMTLAILRTFMSKGLLDTKAISRHNSHYIDKLNIRLANTNNLITSLSGGNQQKVVLAKALGSQPQIVVLDNPTQGVDVGAKLEIYNLIMQLAQEGISFIVLSSEFPEIYNLCDRVYVMFQGKVRAELKREEINENDIMHLATGGLMDGK